MPKFLAILTLSFFVLAGCRSAREDALFRSTCWDDARHAHACLDRYKHVFMVCILEDHWEDRGPNRFALHHYTGTVVRVYRGSLHVSERISFQTALDDRAPKNPASSAGTLAFVFTDEHTDAEMTLDTGEFYSYSAELAPAFEYLFSK